jgi:phage tail sheath gpL-like
MSGAIGFSYIPPNLRVPLFYAEFDNTQAGISQPVQRTLIIGQATTSVVSAPVYIPSVAWAQAAYGIGSQLANAIRAYRASDPVGEIWALPFADAGGGTAATGSIAITGPASANGTLFLYLGGVADANDDTLITVGVTSGQSATVIGAAVAAAINAKTSLRVTAVATTGTVALTATNKGTLGNGIPIVLNYRGAQGGQATPAGLTVTVTAMSGGATDPSLASIATELGSAAFDFIINPYANSTALGYTSAMMSDSAGRWSYAAAVYGHVFSAKADTVANLQTLGSGFNDQHLTILGVNTASPTPADIWLAAAVGACAPSIKAQPNRPVQTLTIAGVLPAPTGQEWSFPNQQALLTSGIAVAQRVDGGSAAWVRAVTTYQENKYSQPDASYLDTETLYTLMAVIRALKSDITQKFPRALIADNGTRIGPTLPGDTPVTVTPSIIAGELVAEYGNLVDQMLCEDEAAFAAGLVVQRNANDNTRVDVLFDPYLVSGLRIFAVLTQFHLLAQQAA